MVRAAIAIVIMPLPAPRGSPVIAGFRPILEIILSAFRAVFAIPTTSKHHGRTNAPVGIVARADRMSFKKSTFITIITIIEAYMRIKPEQILVITGGYSEHGDRFAGIPLILVEREVQRFRFVR